MAHSDEISLQTGCSARTPYLLALLMGLFLSAVVWKIYQLELRFQLAAAGVALVLALGVQFLRRLDDYLLYLLATIIPFSLFTEKLFLRVDSFSPARGLAIGLTELLLLWAFIAWGYRLVVARTEKLQSFNRFDLFVAVYLGGLLVSFLGAPDKQMAFYDLLYNLRYIALYFFVSRRVKRENLKWLFLIFCLAVMAETAVAGLERVTGVSGFARAKGNPDNPGLWEQYEVTSIEHEQRAEGTTIDSHALALYFLMLLPFPLIAALCSSFRPVMRWLAALVAVCGLLGLIVTFSRSGWISFAIISCIGLGTYAVKRKKLHLVAVPAILVLLALMVYPRSMEYFRIRFFETPSGTITDRFEYNRIAINIWRDNPVFGYGPGNYGEAMADPSIELTGRDDNPPHMALLWVGAELGLVGVCSFFGLILFSINRAIRFGSMGDDIVTATSVAICMALVGYLLDGLTDPFFRENVQFGQLWYLVGIIAAISRFLQTCTKTPSGEVA